jgi:hypothetical protein
MPLNSVASHGVGGPSMSDFTTREDRHALSSVGVVPACPFTIIIQVGWAEARMYRPSFDDRTAAAVLELVNPLPACWCFRWTGATEALLSLHTTAQVAQRRPDFSHAEIAVSQSKAHTVVSLGWIASPALPTDRQYGTVLFAFFVPEQRKQTWGRVTCHMNFGPSGK